MTDTSIILSIKNGSTPGYEMLMKKHYGSLLYFLYRMVNNYIDAEDLTMIAFEKAFEKLEKYNGSCKFKTWLYTIAKYTAIDFLREKEIRVNPTITLDMCMHEPDKDTPYDRLIHAENVDIIYECIDRLKEKRREIIRLHSEGYKDQEIAELTGCTHLGIRTKLNRARNQLKSLLYEKNNPVINYCIA